MAARTDGGVDPPADFLRDVGCAFARVNARDDRAENVMRLSKDPLLLNAFLTRRDGPEGRSRPMAVVLPPLGVMTAGSTRSYVQPAYVWRDPVHVPSLVAEPFEASAEDRSEALPAGVATGKTSDRRSMRLLAGAALVCGLLGLIFMMRV